MLKDSGNRRKFSTGSQRDMAEGKGRFDLLPFRALWEVSKQFEDGANKYGDRNWEKGQPLGVFLDSMMRHTAKVMMGWHDEPHDRALVWNALCFLDTVQRIKERKLPKELDDIGWIEEDNGHKS